MEVTMLEIDRAIAALKQGKQLYWRYAEDEWGIVFVPPASFVKWWNASSNPMDRDIKEKRMDESELRELLQIYKPELLDRMITEKEIYRVPG